MAETVEEERRLRKRAEKRAKSLLRELYVARENKRQMGGQLAACDELIRLFSVELNRRAVDQVGKEQYWAVAWLDAHGEEQHEFFPEDQRHVAETLYDRLDATGVRTIQMTMTFVVKEKKEG